MKTSERNHPDMSALHAMFQTGSCFDYRIVARHPNFSAHIACEDAQFIAFLDKHPRRCGRALVSPTQYPWVQVTVGFGVYEHLQRLVR